MTNENRRPERGIVIEIVVGLSQTVKCLLNELTVGLSATGRLLR
jgi:hypothetical protein